MLLLGESFLSASSSKFWSCILGESRRDSETTRGWIFIITPQLCSGQEMLMKEDRQSWCTHCTWHINSPECINPMSWPLWEVLCGFVDPLSSHWHQMWVQPHHDSALALWASCQHASCLDLCVSCVVQETVCSVDDNPQCFLWPRPS